MLVFRFSIYVSNNFSLPNCSATLSTVAPVGEAHREKIRSALERGRVPGSGLQTPSVIGGKRQSASIT